MNDKKVKVITITVTILIIIATCFSIYLIERNDSSSSSEPDTSFNVDSELKEELLVLMKKELSSTWHRYDNWDTMLDDNPYIVCSQKNNTLVASIRHQKYGDIYFIFGKINDEYYVKDYGLIKDWTNYCS